MKNKNVKIFSVFLTIVLFFIWITNTFLENIFHSDRGSPLEDLILKEEITNYKNIAILIEQNEGIYKESDLKKWPTDMIFNEELSGCIDKNGNKIENSLTYENGRAQVRTTETTYCYLYFDIGIDFLSEKLIQLDTKSDIGLQQEFIAGDDLYRFSGTDGNTGINNYICLGTDSCTSGSDNMYRIIGVNPDNREVKVIKETPWNNGTTYVWNTSYVGPTWLTSTLYTGTASGIFDSLSFKDMIVQNHKWNVGQAESVNISTRTNVIDYENNTIGTATIGILSLSDYYLAYNGDRNWYNDYDLTNWISGYHNNNATHEWTMTYYGIYSTAARPWLVSNSYGGTNLQGTINAYTIRPTFYLKPEVMYVKGAGTSSDPFIVNMKTDTEKLIDNVSSDVLWKSTLEDDGYRFVGTNPDNYICFGTTDTSTCTSDTDKYMYRIIGIFENEDGNQHLKLIKKNPLNNTKYMWHKNYEEDDANWIDSDLYKGLNNDYFLTNIEYSYMQNSNWLNKIDEWDYTATNTQTYEFWFEDESYGLYYYHNPNFIVYLHEMNRNNKTSQKCYYFYPNEVVNCEIGEWNEMRTKISLMYVSDYLLSLGNSSLNYVSNNDSSVLSTSWMHALNNITEEENNNEWTMTRRGMNGHGWSFESYLKTGAAPETNFEAYVRPVFYLTSDIELKGSGTLENPYIITN